MRKFNLSGLVMPLLVCCLLTPFMQLTAQNSPQPLTTILKKLGKAYGTSFVYEESLVDKISLPWTMDKSIPLEEQLKKLLYPRGLVFLYVKKDYYAIVSDRYQPGSLVQTIPAVRADAESAPPVSAIPRVAAVPAGSRRIAGRVTDLAGRPLSAVTVEVKGTPLATSTDDQGYYSLNGVPDKGAVLVFSSIGHASRQARIGEEPVINIILTEDSKSLTEVVVVGYGEKKKETLTAAVSTISTKEINENHASSAVSDMLAGRLAGLYVTKSDGTPGSGSSLKVRGLSTFNNSNPLIVIDGIPDRSIDDLNPTDIDAVSVLKDAAAIAVYGARAANGVVLVTTRKGRNGKPEISFSGNLIDQQPTFTYKRMNSYQYAQSYNEALKNENSYSPAAGYGYTDEQLQKYKDGSDPNHYPNTDWIKTLTKSHIIQSNYNLSASGGSDNTRYFLSLGYTKNGGYVPVEYYNRWNFRSNLEARIAKNLLVSFNLGGVLGKTNGEGVYGMDYVIGETYSTPPIRVNQFTNGYYAFVPEQRGNAWMQANGKTGFNTTWSNTLNSTLSLQYDLPWVKGLFLKGTAAYDKGFNFSKKFALPYNQYIIDDAGNYTQTPSYPTAPYLSESYGQSQNLTLEGSIQYNRDFASHHVSGLLLYTQTQISTDNLGAQRQNFVSGALPQLSLGDPSQSTNSGSATQSARQGVVGRVSYDYDTRYLLEFDFRYDGSDIFPPGHRFGFFPSVSGGWIISNEKFFQEPINGLDFLKIRGSWGQLGNDRVNPYQFLSTYSLVGGSSYAAGGYTLGGPVPNFNQAIQANVLPNPSFTWERAILANIGLEAHYKKDLITLEMDYFRKRTRDILTAPNLQVPSVVGLALPNYNDGIVENNGLEITLGHAQHFRKFSYFVQGNISFNNNKIVAYPESKSIPAWQKITGTNVASYGSYVGIGYHAQGLYQTQQEVSSGPTPPFSAVAPGDIRYADIDKSGTISSNDQIVIGNHYFPGIQYGIRCGVQYQGLECNVLLQGSGNVQTYDYAGSGGFYFVAGNASSLNHWTPQNTHAYYPRLWLNNQNNGLTSDYWVVNTAYMRVKNIELAWNLAQKLLRGAGFKNLRVSVTGNNLFTITHFKTYDPEGAGSPAITGNGAGNPLLKSFTAGLSLQF